MYTYAEPEVVFGSFGALQTGTMPQGSTVLVPKGTVVTVIDSRYPTAPKTGPLSNDMSLVLIGDAAVEGDVVGRDLVSVGGEATLAYETGMLVPDPTVAGAVAPGKQVNVPAGTVITIQRLPTAAPPAPPPPVPGPQDGSVVVAPSSSVPWYKRGSTYVVGGGILLIVIVAVAAMRKR